jgi:cytidylate kinase
MAAGGETVGTLVAERLGFRYVDEEIVKLAAREAQVDAGVVAAAEQRQRLLQRLLDNLPSAHHLAGALTLAPVLPNLAESHGHRTVPEEMRLLIRAAIHQVAKAGRAVIVAHAASMALAGVEGVLRVLVTASPEVRAGRVAAAGGLSPAAADAAIAESDFQRRDYLKRFYGVKEELPTHYDLVVNTEVLSAERAAAIIVAAARDA